MSELQKNQTIHFHLLRFGTTTVTVQEPLATLTTTGHQHLYFHRNITLTFGNCYSCIDPSWTVHQPDSPPINRVYNIIAYKQKIEIRENGRKRARMSVLRNNN
jgi:hypothetical protein